MDDILYVGCDDPHERTGNIMYVCNAVKSPLPIYMNTRVEWELLVLPAFSNPIVHSIQLDTMTARQEKKINPFHRAISDPVCQVGVRQLVIMVKRKRERERGKGSWRKQKERRG